MMSNLMGIEIPEINKAKKILAIQPHYDDNDFSAGGTLAVLAENGAEIHYLTMSDDLVGVIDESWTAEESTKRLRDDQFKAGKFIGVSKQYWLGYPDAGEYNYYEVRNDMIKYIRIVQPDVLFTMDPWMLYEAHRDHVLASRAAAEASILYDFLRIKTDPEVDENYTQHKLQAVVFHATSYPNTVFDITSTIGKKVKAISSYKAQFHNEDFPQLIKRTELYARHIARNVSFEFGEALKIIPPSLLHGISESIHF